MQHGPPLPKRFGAPHIEVCPCRIPEPIMQLDAEGQSGIKVVAPPLVTGLADHRGKMVSSGTSRRVQFLVPKRRNGTTALHNGVPRTIQIEVVLRAMRGFIAVERRVSKPLEHHEFYP